MRSLVHSSSAAGQTTARTPLKLSVGRSESSDGQDGPARRAAVATAEPAAEAAAGAVEAGVGVERGRSTVHRGKCPGKNENGPVTSGHRLMRFHST